MILAPASGGSTQMSYRGSIAGKGRHAEEMKAKTEINAITLKSQDLSLALSTLPLTPTPLFRFIVIMHISEVFMSTGMPYKLTNMAPSFVPSEQLLSLRIRVGLSSLSLALTIGPVRCIFAL